MERPASVPHLRGSPTLSGRSQHTEGAGQHGSPLRRGRAIAHPQKRQVTRPETDTRDCRRLARLHRAGDLVAIRIPTVQEEAIRDLCRTRAEMVEDRTRARHRLSKFLLRHGRIWRDGTTAWTQAHERWRCCQQFDEPALQTTYAHYRAALQSRDTQLVAIEADLAGWYDRPPFAAQVARLAAYRGVTQLGALTLAAEVGDWRRFARAASCMGFCGLVPSEYSSGQRACRGI
jgi:transposase